MDIIYTSSLMSFDEDEHKGQNMINDLRNLKDDVDMLKHLNNQEEIGTSMDGYLTESKQVGRKERECRLADAVRRSMLTESGLELSLK